MINIMPIRKFFLSLIIFSSILVFSNYTYASDITSPTTVAIQTPAAPNGLNGWYKTPVNFKLDATDLESGIKEMHYKINSNSWEIVSFSDSLNLAPNPSFEISGVNSTGIQDWEITNNDGLAVYTKDTSAYLPGFSISSAKIQASEGLWHGINNKNMFAVTAPFANMSASIWVKTVNVVNSAYFIIYIVSQDAFGNITYTQAAQSNPVSGTAGWTRLDSDFVVNDPDAIGIYMDFGLNGAGTIWADAAIISESQTTASIDVSILTDGSAQTIEYYSVDFAGNTETSLCPTINCKNVSIDQTPPGNWHDSGAYRSLTGSEHEVFVFTNVDDATSGLSISTNKYQYTVSAHPDFGKYANLLYCNTAWKTGDWAALEEYVLTPGLKTAPLTTQKTDFCDSNWKICKIVRFYAQDVAGNEITKDFCINGPWLKIRGEGIVRANQNIDMISEPEEDNADGLIEIGGTTVDFFNSSKNWVVKSITQPASYTYSDYSDLVGNKTELGTELISASGIYYKNENFEINNQSIPSNYDDAVFNQVVFINGTLAIENNINISDDSTVVFIVNGDIKIAKSVDEVEAGLFSDQSIYTAYDINPDESSKMLTLKGLYSAQKIYFQRTLQGTNNQKYPSVDITYEPKYLLQIRDIFGKNYIIWKNIN